MAVVNVTVWRPQDGRAAEFLGQVAQAKKIHERLGGRVRVLQASIGPNPFTVHYVVEHDDERAFGEFMGKMASDQEWQSFWAGALTNPSAQPLEGSLLADMPLP